MKAATLLLLAFAATGTLRAQDADPFFAGNAPLVMDASRTGFDPGARISFIHRDQWLQLPGTWRNEQLAAEWCARNHRRQVRSWLGLGMMAGRDHQGAQEFENSFAGFSSAMHLRAGSRSYLSAGINLRWVNSTVGDVDGTWGSQYDGMRYDPGLASGESWTNGNHAWAEAGAGLSFTLKAEEESRLRREPNVLVAGISADHLGHLRLRDDGPPLTAAPVCFTAYAMGKLPDVGWDNGFLSAELITRMQGPIQTGRLNLYVGKDQLNRVRQKGGPALLGFKTGVGYRWQDALLVNAALDWGNATFGMAYGWSLFGTNKMTAGRRTFEFMLQVRLPGKGDGRG